MSATFIDHLARPAAGGTTPGAKIGPNAITQLVPAMRAAGLSDRLPRIFAAAGAQRWLEDPPSGMVDEDRVARVHRAVRAMLRSEEAERVLSDAGRRTADYLLAHRIPRPVQVLLRILPAPLAAALLASSIRSHAWTFAGSGQFRVCARSPAIFELSHNPLRARDSAAAPGCVWHLAVFQRLFEVLITPRARAAESECEARGGACCRFEVRWGPG